MGLIERNKWAAYMETGSGESAVYTLMGEGFKDLSENKNPKEYTRQYVHERTERSDVTGYAPQIAYSVDAYSDNAVITKIIEVTDQEKTGADAVVSIVSVNLFDGSDGSYTAYKRNYAIIPNSKGSGTDALIYTGNLKAQGDAVAGTFATATNTFTAAA